MGGVILPWLMTLAFFFTEFLALLIGSRPTG